MSKYLDPMLALYAICISILFFGHACVTKDYISPWSVFRGNPTHHMGKWYQCKEVEIKP